MVETVSSFPFQRIRYDKFLILDVMMNVKYQESYNFMFGVNKEARLFLQNNFISIRNGFINDGLIQYEIKCDFNGFLQLEKLYFSALKRNIRNRILFISIDMNKSNFKFYNKVLKCIKAQ